MAIRRKLYRGGTEEHKSIDKCFYALIRNNPNLTKMTILCNEGDDLSWCLKSVNVVRKGRWYYYDYKGKLYYIKIIKISKPEGSKEFQCSRIINPKLTDYTRE